MANELRETINLVNLKKKKEEEKGKPSQVKTNKILRH